MIVFLSRYSGRQIACGETNRIRTGWGIRDISFSFLVGSRRIEPVGRLRPTFGYNIDMAMGLDWINLVMIGTSVSLL